MTAVLLGAGAIFVASPAAFAHSEPAPLVTKTAASAAHLSREVAADGLVSAADFSVNLGAKPGAKIVYFDPASGLLFHDTSISSVMWGASAVTIRGLGTLNGKRVTFYVHAVDGGGKTNGAFQISWNGGAMHGGRIAAGSVTIS